MTLILACGCRHHIRVNASSDDDADVEVSAQISLDITLPGTDRKLMPAEGLVRRFIVEASDVNGLAPKRFVVYSDDVESTAVTKQLTMMLPPIEHMLTIWSDYVKGTEDLLYDTYTLKPVVFRDRTVANNEAKDAFAGTVRIDLRPYAAQTSTKIETKIDLSRVTGRYEIVATDADAFRRSIDDGIVTGKEYRVRISYGAYIACGYNCEAGVRKELFPDISYTTPLLIPKSGSYEQTLCFDYCLCAPGEKVEIPARIEVLNEYDEIIADSHINLPVANGMNTVVKGRFLTGHITGGIGVDPSFDGIIDIDLGTIVPEDSRAL